MQECLGNPLENSSSYCHCFLTLKIINQFEKFKNIISIYKTFLRFYEIIKNSILKIPCNLNKQKSLNNLIVVKISYFVTLSVF